MPTRPDQALQWASDAGAEVALPPRPSRRSGWLRPIKPPNAWLNWWQRRVSEWITYLSQSIAFFDDLEEAIAATPVGGICVVYETDEPAQTIAEVDTGITAPSILEGCIDACGSLVVFAAGDNDARGVRRDLVGAETAGTPVVTYARPGGTVVSQIRTNGAVTVLAYGAAAFTVRAFDAETGTSLWTFDLDAAVPIDMVLVGDRVIVAHTTSSGAGDTIANRQIHCLDAADGSVIWSYRQMDSAPLTAASLATDGRAVFFAGTASDFASLANFRAIRLSDGADATGEGGGPVDTTGLAWDSVLVNLPLSGAMCCDGEAIYLGKPSTAPTQIEARSIANGSTIWVWAHPDATASIRRLRVDHEYVYAAVRLGAANPSEGYVEAYRRQGGLAWRWITTDYTAAQTAMVGIATDGCTLYALAEDEPALFRIGRGNVPRSFLRVDVAIRDWSALPLKPLVM